jgi:hypothetical protein
MKSMVMTMQNDSERLASYNPKKNFNYNCEGCGEEMAGIIKPLPHNQHKDRVARRFCKECEQEMLEMDDRDVTGT